METEPASLTATVCVLTFNGGQFLEEVIDACLAQDAPFAHEVVVIDSGSTDATLDIVARHPEVRLHRISNREFGHGRTRNLAASMSSAEFVVFLTQDATPIGDTWLMELMAPLMQDPSLAGVFARQVPRPGCGPTAAREVTQVFCVDPPPGFFSNVCSAVRRTVLERVPFRDLDYAEDRAFAADASAAGLRVTYAPNAAVLHSHDLPVGGYFRRMYDEARGMTAVGTPPRTGLVWLAGATVRGTARDWAFVASHPGYAPAGKLAWAVRVPAYNVARRLAIWLAGRQLPGRLARGLSLEARHRRAAVGG